MRVIPFTKAGFEKLEKELENEILKRPSAVNELKRGRDLGDLSENGLYKAAKFELSNIDRQIRNLKSLIKQAKIMLPTGLETVQIGHKILVEIEKEIKEYELVGEYEANPGENKISFKSPVGHNLMGRKTGDEIKINTPNGLKFFKVKSIKKI